MSGKNGADDLGGPEMLPAAPQSLHVCFAKQSAVMIGTGGSTGGLLAGCSASRHAAR